MGWIQDGEALFPLSRVEAIQINAEGDLDGWADGESWTLAKGEEAAEAEFDRIAAWLNDGAQGVYVVGEGPMRGGVVAGLVSAARRLISKLPTLGTAHMSDEAHAEYTQAWDGLLTALEPFGEEAAQ